MDRLLLSVPDAARVLDIGRSQMWELIGRREIESVKIGRLRKVPREAVDDYVARLRREQGAAASA